jgi:glyoxylase-like metal-dependent hydrolase (beta-lactamase superfamily II)
MTDTRKAVARGERILPGLWRLRLPLPWPGVPHGNAYAIRAGDGIVLVDCGMWLPDEGSFADLEQALRQVGLRLEEVSDLVITHAHVDHWGQAGPVIERSGARLWLHPDHAHGRASLDDPEAALTRRLEVGRQSGVPERQLRAYLEQARTRPSGIAALIEPDAALVTGVRIDTDLGPLEVNETPGHAPSHVSLYGPDHRLLISGDHLLGRISLYYDYGWTPDPVGEFLQSLDTVERLGARLCVSGHGRPFTDVPGHIAGNRALVAERVDATRTALALGPLTAVEVVAAVFGEPLSPLTAGWWLPEALCYLTHLERLGEVTREPDGTAERWALREP